MKKSSTIGEQIEKIDVLGQENEKKAAKWVMKEGDQERKIEDRKENEELDKLQTKKRKGQLFGYTDEIVAATTRRMFEFEIPKGFYWQVYKTKNGRGIEIRYMTPMGKVYARGMNVCFNPEYDVNWIIRTIHKALDEMEALDEMINPQDYASKREANKIIV